MQREEGAIGAFLLFAFRQSSARTVLFVSIVMHTLAAVTDGVGAFAQVGKRRSVLRLS